MIYEEEMINCSAIWGVLKANALPRQPARVGGVSLSLHFTIYRQVEEKWVTLALRARGGREKMGVEYQGL